jgi:hypothetical protein
VAALEQPAVDEDAFSCAFDQMARAGDVAVGAVEGQFQGGLLGLIVVGSYLSFVIARFNRAIQYTPIDR